MTAGDAPRVECASHGSTAAAFVCQHLAQGEGQGFHRGEDPDAPDALYPDAWCDACEARVEAADGWDDAAVAAAGITMVCTQCYLDIRTRNWREDADAFLDFACTHFRALEPQQEAFRRDFELARWERWDWDYDSQQLVFSHAGHPRVVADVVFVGTLATGSRTWMWTWANEHLPLAARAAARPVREAGEATGFMKFATGFWRAGEDDGWLMTAFAAHVLGAIGAYRTPGERSDTYMVILHARRLA